MGVFDFLTEYSSLVTVVAVALLTTYLTWKEKRNARIKQLENDKKENEKKIVDYQIECLGNRLTEIEKDLDYLKKVLDEVRYKK